MAHLIIKKRKLLLKKENLKKSQILDIHHKRYT